MLSLSQTKCKLKEMFHLIFFFSIERVGFIFKVKMKLGSFQEYTVKEQQLLQVNSCWKNKEKILQDGSGEALEQIVL